MLNNNVIGWGSIDKQLIAAFTHYVFAIYESQNVVWLKLTIPVKTNLAEKSVDMLYIYTQSFTHL